MNRETVKNVVGDIGLIGLFLWLWLNVWWWLTRPR